MRKTDRRTFKENTQMQKPLQQHYLWSCMPRSDSRVVQNHWYLHSHYSSHPSVFSQEKVITCYCLYVCVILFVFFLGTICFWIPWLVPTLLIVVNSTNMMGQEFMYHLMYFMFLNPLTCAHFVHCCDLGTHVPPDVLHVSESLEWCPLCHCHSQQSEHNVSRDSETYSPSCTAWIPYPSCYCHSQQSGHWQ